MNNYLHTPLSVLLLISMSFFSTNLKAQCEAIIFASSPEICTNDVAFLDASASTGNGVLTYTWNTGETTPNIYTPISGEYSVTVTDADGCESTSTYFLFDAPYLEAYINASTTVLTCSEPSIILDSNGSIPGSGNIIYNWSTGETTPSIIVTVAGTYTLEIIDVINGCFSTTSINITGDGVEPTVNISSSTPEICTNDVAYLSAIASTNSGNSLSYAWNTGETLQDIYVFTSGEYTVTVTDNSNGCSATASYLLFEAQYLEAIITANTSILTCSEASVVLDGSNSIPGSGNIVYIWSTGETTPSIIATVAGTYTLEILDAINGCSSFATYSLVEEQQAPYSIINSSNEIDCNNPTTILDGSPSISFNGALSYLWSTGETTPMITVSSGGTYSLEVTDEGGCSAISFIPVQENTTTPIAVITASSTEINAQNPTVVLDASTSMGNGLLSYLWSDNSTSTTLTVSSGGNYIVTVTDIYNGCNDTATIFITENLIELYVDHTATGTNDGSSWTNAFTDLQDALAIGGTIHVAKGTYYPTSGTTRGTAFQPISSTTVLGGYPNGGGTRNPSSNETILSGNIDGVSSYAGNSYHVVSVKNANNVTLDGLTIRDGNADNANSFGRSRGGGLFVNNATLTLTDVEVKWNKAVYGAGMFATLSPNVTIDNCTFKKNTANNGSAIYHSNETNLYINKTRIVDNNALVRCAIEVNNSLYTKIENSVIADNASANANAIAFIATNRDGACDIYNTTILGETKNKFLITMQVGFGDQLDLSLYNSIIAHQNPAFTQAFKDFNNGILNLNTTNCYIMGSTVLGNATNNLYSTTAGDLVLNSDYSLGACSPGVDDGDDAYAAGSTDINGVLRIINTVDMGAYENVMACRFAAKESGTLAASEIAAFPNPVRDILNIQTDLENPTFHLFDLLGKEVLNTQAKEINLEQFPQGMYILRVMEGNELIESIKIMKE